MYLTVFNCMYNLLSKNILCKTYKMKLPTTINVVSIERNFYELKLLNVKFVILLGIHYVMDYSKGLARQSKT